MSDIKKINELSGKILDCEDKIESIEHKISEIRKDKSKVQARMELEINNNRRSSSRYYLDKHQVLLILEDHLHQYKTILKSLKRDYTLLTA